MVWRCSGPRLPGLLPRCCICMLMLRPVLRPVRRRGYTTVSGCCSCFVQHSRGLCRHPYLYLVCCMWCMQGLKEAAMAAMQACLKVRPGIITSSCCGCFLCVMPGIEPQTCTTAGATLVRLIGPFVVCSVRGVWCKARQCLHGLRDAPP